MASRFVAGVALLLYGACMVYAEGETLFSNWAVSVAPGPTAGQLWVYSRGEVNQGVALLPLTLDASGKIKVGKSQVEPVDNEFAAVHYQTYADKLAERRRFPMEVAGDLGVVLPMFGLDEEDHFQEPRGFFSLKDAGVIPTPLDVPPSVESIEDPMDYAVSGFAYMQAKKTLNVARGCLGIVEYDISKGAGNPQIDQKILDKKSHKWEKLPLSGTVDFSKYLDVFDLEQNPETGDLWIATSQGLWRQPATGDIVSASKALEKERVTGVWIGGSPLQAIVETSSLNKGVMTGGLWRKVLGAKDDFKKVVFLDSAGAAQKKDIYDNADYTVTGVAFMGDKAYVGVWVAGGSVSGYLLLDSRGVRTHGKGVESTDPWLNDFETGVTDRDAIITAITKFPLNAKTMGLAVATDGNGISVSADSGKTWTPVLNRAKLGGNLGSVRMVPSVIVAGGESLVSYKVGKDSKITIEVFSYDMRRVRKIVSGAPRLADESRSTNAKEDFWDGLDDAGRPCTMGIYYVRVKDNHGHVGWGKVMSLGGGR
ncbi:MAG: hypothetical protein IJ896_06725 [Fibrobacter sp.]|nr:hypothetical protein [Fibrobacter sp.]